MSGRTIDAPGPPQPAAPAPASSADRTRTEGVRVDIQGLRAIAVSLVLVFHLWPAALPGGYIGVDVFFVVSGFLITAHLLREVDRTGTVSLPRFWARRARRLLPAALTVLAATLVAVLAFVPAGLVAPFVRQIMASGLYVENWVLAAESVDYLAAENAPSPVQHYWSLSAEEQFYLLWPVLVLAAVWIAARVGGRIARRGARMRMRMRPVGVIGIVLGAVVAASLIWSLVYTARDPSQAYFVTTTRAWEFGLGGLLALVAGIRSTRVRGLADRVTPGVRAAVSWAGLAAIVAAALTFTGATAFPGWAALLPVAGTLAVIAVHDPEHPLAPRRLLGVRPVQWLGDVSYAVYLWHWPLITLLPYLFGRGLSFADRVLVLALTLVLAGLTKRFVEDPVRRGAPSRWRPRVVLIATAGAMAALMTVSVSGVTMGEERVASEHDRIEALVSDQPECLGAAALEPFSGCDAYATVLDSVVPDPALADDPPERCIAGTRGSELEVCEYGVAAEDAVRSIALIGDSHAEQWMPSIAAVATQRGWHLYVVAKSSCPFSGAERYEDDMSAESLEEMNASCATWNESAVAFLGEHPEIDTIITSTRSRNPVRADDGETWQQTAVERYQERWRELPQSVANIVVLRDTPVMPQSILACVAENGTDASEACVVDQAEAIGRDPLVEAAQSSDDPRVRIVDLTEYFCSDGSCPPVVGGVLAYRDTHHISWVYAETLAPYLDERLVARIGVAAPSPS